MSQSLNFLKEIFHQSTWLPQNEVAILVNSVWSVLLQNRRTAHLSDEDVILAHNFIFGSLQLMDENARYLTVITEEDAQYMLEVNNLMMMGHTRN